MRLSLKRSKILIVVFGVLFILSLNFFQKEVRGFFYSISAPIQKTLWEGGDRVSDFFETIVEIKNLKKENESLKLKNQELLAEIVSLRELKKENQILREALEIGLQKEFKLTLAEVIGKDINQDSILINQGLREGIFEGMPVITSQKVLLGKITEVYENFSRVMLISNKESSFDVKIADTNITGIVNGKGGLNLVLDLIPKDQEIKEGALLITSNLGGIYPQNLLVGLIKEIKKSDLKPFQQAEVLPFFDLRELEKVFIILDF